MERNPTRMCEVLVGLGDVDVRGVGEPLGGGVEAEVRGRAGRPRARAAGAGSGRRAPGWWSWSILRRSGGRRGCRGGNAVGRAPTRTAESSRSLSRTPG